MTEIFEPTELAGDTLIRPFNFDSAEEFEEMYNRPRPDDVAAVISLFHTDDEGEAAASALLADLLADGNDTSLGMNEPTVKMMKYYSSDYLPWHLQDVMSTKQGEWWHRGVYVECGFWRPSLADDIAMVRSITSAMTWYDIHVKSHWTQGEQKFVVMSLEQDGVDDRTPEIVARNFRLTVNDIFREGVGIWCQGLVPVRNEILVKLRARLVGEDPELAWERFSQAGLTCYLDYTLLPNA